MAVSAGTITIGAEFTAALASGVYNLNPYTRNLYQTMNNAFGDGAGAGLVNRLFGGIYTAAGAPVSIDLTAVTCLDSTTGMATVRALLVFNADAVATHTLKFGDDAVETNLFLGGLLGTHPQKTIQASDTYVDQHPMGATGYTVDGTHKNLRFDPGANTVTFCVIVAGTT